MSSIQISVWVVVLLVVMALAFDFMNGFHDGANSISTIVATGALTPKQAVLFAAAFNFLALWIFQLKVAATVGKGIVEPGIVDHHVVFGALVGAIIWNLVTWYYGLPSSSSHAMFGGLIGATIAGLGVDGVKWVGTGDKLDGVVGKIILPGLASPTIAALVAMVGTWLVFRISRGVAERYLEINGVWEDHIRYAITAEEWDLRRDELLSDWLL